MLGLGVHTVAIGDIRVGLVTPGAVHGLQLMTYSCATEASPPLNRTAAQGRNPAPLWEIRQRVLGAAKLHDTERLGVPRCRQGENHQTRLHATAGALRTSGVINP